MKALFRRLHRWCGLTVAGLLCISAITGSLIAFEHELDRLINPQLFRTGNLRQAMPVDALIARIEAQEPQVRVAQMPLDTPPGEAREVHVAPRPQAGGPTAAPRFDRLFVDPATARILGRRQWGAWQGDRAHLMPWLNRFHRTLTLPGRLGNRLLGGAAIAWLGLSLAGLYLTLPARQRGRAAALPRGTRLRAYLARWRPAWQMPWKGPRFRFVNDLHRALGLWLLPLALCSALTGIYLNLGNEVFKPVVSLFGHITPHPLARLPQRDGRQADGRLPAGAQLPAAQALEQAQSLLPAEALHYQPWYLAPLPQQGAYRIAFKEPGLREAAWRVRYEQVFIDSRSGSLLARFGYPSGTGADRFLVWMYPLHSGKLWGLPGRVLICLAGLGTAALCIAGVLRWTFKKKS